MCCSLLMRAITSRATSVQLAGWALAVFSPGEDISPEINWTFALDPFARDTPFRATFVQIATILDALFARYTTPISARRI